MGDLCWHTDQSEILPTKNIIIFFCQKYKSMKIKYIHLAKLCVCMSLLLFLKTLSERTVKLKAVTSLPYVTPYKCVNTSALHRGESSWHRPASVWQLWCRFEGSHLCEGSPGGRVGVWRHPGLGSLGEGACDGGYEDHGPVSGGSFYRHWLQYWSVIKLDRKSQ